MIERLLNTGDSVAVGQLLLPRNTLPKCGRLRRLGIEKEAELKRQNSPDSETKTVLDKLHSMEEFLPRLYGLDGTGPSPNLQQSKDGKDEECNRNSTQKGESRRHETIQVIQYFP